MIPLTNKPIWPTLYKHVEAKKCIHLSQEYFNDIAQLYPKFESIQGFRGITSEGEGFHKVHESASGGLMPFGKEFTYYDSKFWEMQFQVRTIETKNTYLYLLCSLNEFRNGYMFHCGWQYPHCNRVSRDTQDRLCFETYLTIVNTVYRILPHKISKFILETQKETL